MEKCDITINIKTGNIINLTVSNSFESTGFCKKSIDIPKGNTGEHTLPDTEPIELLLIYEKNNKYADLTIKLQGETEETPLINPIVLFGKAVVKKYLGTITFKNNSEIENDNRIIEIITAVGKAIESLSPLLNKLNSKTERSQSKKK